MKIFVRLALGLSLMISTVAHAAAPPQRAEDVQPISVGQALPDVAVGTLDGDVIALHAALENKPTVLVFYRGGWCPFCNRQLSELRLIQEDLEALGYQIVAISPDSPAKLREGVKKTPVDYTLLSDASGDLILALGIAFRLDDDNYEKYLGYGVDLEQSSGFNHRLLPVPTVIVADSEGVIRHLEANPDYKVRPSNEDVLNAARTHAD